MNKSLIILSVAAMMPLLPVHSESHSTHSTALPKYVLEAKQEANGCQVDANAIMSLGGQDAASYHWGVKYSDRPIDWCTTQEPTVFVSGTEGEVTVYFKACDANGQYSPVQFVNVKAQPLFFVTNSAYSIDSDKKLYFPDGSEYTYKYGIIYLDRNTNLPSEYQTAIWTPTKATVFSPFGANYSIPVDRGEFSVREVVPETELTNIFQHSVSGQSHVYLVALQNPENKVMQVVPVTMTLK